MALNIRFILFSIGLGATISSSIMIIFFLSASLFDKPCLVYESNPWLAFFEITLLVFGIGTSLTASEIYHKYLESQEKQRK